MEEQSPTKQPPGQLELVERFVNSLHMHESHEDEEAFVSPAALRAWLAERDLISGDEEVTEGDLRRAVDVREGLRALALANNGVELDTAAVERLDRAASRAGLRVQSLAGLPRLEPDAGGVDGALAALLGAVATSVADGSWDRFKACPRDCCQWAFYDNSKNRSARWCDMASCGNVEKARAYRQRKSRMSQ
jgi:predicted RNA-binding Zn ribbon-like protein